MLIKAFKSKQLPPYDLSDLLIKSTYVRACFFFQDRYFYFKLKSAW